MEFDILKDLPSEERLAWYADDIMKAVDAIDDIMTQIDTDEPKEKVQRNLRILMLALHNVADEIGRDVIATREERRNRQNDGTGEG